VKVLKNPKFNAAVIAVISIFYAFVFIITSGHIEFNRMLNHSATLNNNFWNLLTLFLKQGHLKYIGYAYIVAAVIIAAPSFVREQDYDEYQAHILGRGFIVSGIAMVFLFPVALVMILSDPNYSIETLVFLVVAQWSVVLVTELLYTLSWLRR